MKLLDTDGLKYLIEQFKLIFNGKQDELSTDRKRKITFGTDEPQNTDGDNGDIYLQYEE